MVKKNRRVLPLFLGLAIIIVLAVVFRSFFMTNIVQPVTLVLWGVWRIISSVHQKVYWGLVIAISLFLAIRMIPSEWPHFHTRPENDRPVTGNGHSSWLSTFTSALSDANSLDDLRRKLINLYLSVVAQENKITTTSAEDYLRSRPLPVSEETQLFYSAEKKTLRARFYAQKLRLMISLTASRMLRGHKVPSAIQKPVDEILGLMEDHTEINHEK